MSLSLIVGALWVIAVAITAFLPYRRQIWTGLPLLIAAPVLLFWIGRTQGFGWVLIGLFAFGSMFRRPLSYFARRALGLPLPELPPDLRRDARE